MDDDTLTIVLVVLGVGAVAWFLINRGIPKDPISPDGENLSDITKGNDIYTKGANLVWNALTNPNAIQHVVGLPGSDGWGQGIFSGDYDDLPDDVKVYHDLAITAKQAQEQDVSADNRRFFYAVATAIMPALADGKCCDFDPGVPLARGGGSMHYLGNYTVSFNQDGYQKTASFKKVPPRMASEDYPTWLRRVGLSAPNSPTSGMTVGTFNPEKTPVGSRGGNTSTAATAAWVKV